MNLFRRRRPAQVLSLLDHVRVTRMAGNPRVVAPANRIFFDTEFIEDGHTIDLISIGMVREDGRAYYAEPFETDHSRANDWVKANVLPHLAPNTLRKPREVIAAEIVHFVGTEPSFWAYYADYDWVALCQLYGTMMDLPLTWPKFCLDVKQLAVMKGNPRLPKQQGPEHNALVDARWTLTAWESLQ